MPRMKENGAEVHDDWTTLPLEYVAKTYCTVNDLPSVATAPDPLMRSEDSIAVGGAPRGYDDGPVPHRRCRGGEGWATGAKATGANVVVVLVVVLVVEELVVVVVAGDFFPEKRSAQCQ